VTAQRAHSRDALAAREDERLRALVLGYLDEHPMAMDTLDGIAEWWIRRRQIEVEVRRVSSVLEALVHEGVLEETHQSGLSFFRRRRSANGRSSGTGSSR
jgi:hypothetical protein